MQSYGEVQSMAANIFSAYASMAASAMLFRSIAKDILPQPVRSFFFSIFGRFFKYLMSKFFSDIPNMMTMVVDENTGFTRNQIYDAAEVYLGTKIDLDSERLKVNKGPKQKAISLSMEKGQEVIDWYKDILKLKWKFHLVEPEPERGRGKDKRHFEITFDRNYREVVMNEYLPFVLAKAKEIRENERGIKLYTRDCPFQDNDDGGKMGGRGGGWGCINLDHPITFDKLAMDKKLKSTIMEDLDMFVRRKDYYKQVGKAWKRGYLLYGPPGTGKSSLVAAMANRLQFDVYDLQLSSVRSDSDLRRILFSTNNKSILVVEDIDCSSPTHQRSGNEDKKPSSNTELTLSGLLNFIDGLWSSCGDERIIVFTSNHKEKLDPALLRPGRMDMHIHLGYCTPEGFDVLAFNYLGLRNHPVFFPEIKGLIQQVKISPAELAEHLMRSETVEIALEGVIHLLKHKEEEQRQKEMQKQNKEMQRKPEKINDDAYGNDNGITDENVKAPKSSRKSGKFAKIFTGLRKSKMQS